MSGSRSVVRSLGLVAAVLACAGCEADVRDGLGPRVPTPNLHGTVVREGAAASGLDVDLRRLPEDLVLATASTDAGGGFDFTDVAAGRWEVKVGGDAPGDFESVTRAFDLVDAGRALTLAPVDVSAYGAGLLEPADSAALPPPTPTQPLRFRWVRPDRPLDSGRVQVYDASGQAVWLSVRTLEGEIAWNGLGTEGSYAGLLVPPGTYRWRVKFELPDTVEARTAYRALVLQ